MVPLIPFFSWPSRSFLYSFNGNKNLIFFSFNRYVLRKGLRRTSRERPSDARLADGQSGPLQRIRPTEQHGFIDSIAIRCKFSSFFTISNRPDLELRDSTADNDCIISARTVPTAHNNNTNCCVRSTHRRGSWEPGLHLSYKLTGWISWFLKNIFS